MCRCAAWQLRRHSLHHTMRIRHFPGSMAMPSTAIGVFMTCSNLWKPAKLKLQTLRRGTNHGTASGFTAFRIALTTLIRARVDSHVHGEHLHSARSLGDPKEPLKTHQTQSRYPPQALKPQTLGPQTHDHGECCALVLGWRAWQRHWSSSRP